MQERRHESTAGCIDMHGDFPTGFRILFNQGLVYRLDGFKFSAKGRAQNGHHANGIFIRGLENLFRGDDVSPFLHRDILGFNFPVAAELLPYDLYIRAKHQVRFIVSFVLCTTPVTPASITASLEPIADAPTP